MLQFFFFLIFFLLLVIRISEVRHNHGSPHSLIVAVFNSRKQHHGKSRRRVFSRRERCRNEHSLGEEVGVYTSLFLSLIVKSSLYLILVQSALIIGFLCFVCDCAGMFFGTSMFYNTVSSLYFYCVVVAISMKHFLSFFFEFNLICRAICFKSCCTLLEAYCYPGW